VNTPSDTRDKKGEISIFTKIGNEPKTGHGEREKRDAVMKRDGYDPEKRGMQGKKQKAGVNNRNQRKTTPQERERGRRKEGLQQKHNRIIN